MRTPSLVLLSLMAVLLPVATAHPSPPRCFGAASRDAAAPCRNAALADLVTPSPDAALLEPSEPCQPVLVTPPVCTFGVPWGRSTDAFALVGDSHAVHWRAALTTVARRADWTGYSLTRSTCPYTLPVKASGGRCAGFAQSVLDWLTQHPEIHAVFMSGNATHPPPGAPGYVALDTRVRGFERAIQALPPSITHVFVIHDVPHSSLRTQDCVRRAMARRLNAGAVCARSRKGALPGDPAYLAARYLGGRAVPVDLTSFMCGPAHCYPVIGGALVIKDLGHLTRTFARTLGPYLWRAVRAALG